MPRSDNWKNPTILEHLLHDKRKCEKLIGVLTELGLKVEAHADGKWFDIVRKDK